MISRGRFTPRDAYTFALAILSLALCLTLGGCGITASEWRAAGIDALKCAQPSVMNAAASAIGELFEMAMGQNVDMKQVGVELAMKYGATAAECAVAKVWTDLGGGSGVRRHASQPFLVADYLMSHRDEWAK
jgi:hypothetical protein